MGMWIGRNRKARVTYGFDEIALVMTETHRGLDAARLLQLSGLRDE